MLSQAFKKPEKERDQAFQDVAKQYPDTGAGHTAQAYHVVFVALRTQQESSAQLIGGHISTTEFRSIVDGQCQRLQEAMSSSSGAGALAERDALKLLPILAESAPAFAQAQKDSDFGPTITGRKSAFKKLDELQKSDTLASWVSGVVKKTHDTLSLYEKADADMLEAVRGRDLAEAKKTLATLEAAVKPKPDTKLPPLVLDPYKRTIDYVEILARRDIADLFEGLGAPRKLARLQDKGVLTEKVKAALVLHVSCSDSAVGERFATNLTISDPKELKAVKAITESMFGKTLHRNR
jgi:hypothetical protein